MQRQAGIQKPDIRLVSLAHAAYKAMRREQEAAPVACVKRGEAGDSKKPRRKAAETLREVAG